MLSFSRDQVVFDYQERKHLTTIIELTNHSNVTVCFKVQILAIQFKVNRPKYYLVKPDRGTIQPGETKPISITLHKDVLV